MSHSDSYAAPDDPASRRETSTIERWLRLLGVTESEGDRLRTLGASLSPQTRDFAESFFRGLAANDEMGRRLADRQMIERLKTLQHEHFVSIFEANWDQRFLDHRKRVGEAHAERGVEPEYLLSAYSLYLQRCFPQLQELSSGDIDDFGANALALVKAILLDIGLTLQSYFAHSTDDLRQALDMYWRANNQLRNFARLTSHDLKTPLATVANLCEETIDEFSDEMPPEAIELVERAKTRSYRMSEMIDELLSAALTTGGYHPAHPVELDSVIGQAVDLVRPEIVAKRIDLRVPDKLPRVCCDRIRLREAIYNLLSNAAKFIDGAHGRIDIEFQQNAEEAVLAVRDNGPGIPPDELDRVFVPFRRLPHHRELPGSGLGLYFTKNLIEEEGGRVWAESSPGRGACFYISLPLEPPAAGTKSSGGGATT